MTINLQSVLESLAVIFTIGGLWLRIEVKVAEMRQWQNSHDRNDDVRHGENRDRMDSLERELRELNTRLARVEGSHREEQ